MARWETAEGAFGFEGPAIASILSGWVCIGLGSIDKVFGKSAILMSRVSTVSYLIGDVWMKNAFKIMSLSRDTRRCSVASAK